MLEFVEEFRIEYLTRATNYTYPRWKEYKNGKCLSTGLNSTEDDDDIKSIAVEPFKAETVRIIPTKWRGLRSGRVDIIVGGKYGQSEIFQLGLNPTKLGNPKMKWSSTEEGDDEEEPLWNTKTGLSAEYGFHPAKKEWTNGFKVDIKFDSK